MRAPMVSGLTMPKGYNTTGKLDPIEDTGAQAAEPSPLIERFVTRVSLHRERAAVCPRCGSHYLHQSSRKWWERLFAPLSARRPHYCEACLWRGWRRPDPYR